MTKKLQHTKDSDDTVLDIIKKLPNDEKYLKPLTDDYAYVIKHNYPDEGDGYFEQSINLYSFDDSGKLLQFVSREYNSSLVSGNYDLQSYYKNFTQQQLDQGMAIYDETNKVLYEDMLALYGGDNFLYSGMNEDDTQKEILMQDLLTGGQHAGYYFSKL